MARLIWKEGAVVSLQLKDGSFVLAQLFKAPFMAFYQGFRDDDNWPVDAAESAVPLFFCAVARQFLLQSPLTRAAHVRAKVFDATPTRWIMPNLGSRTVTIWPGQPNEATFEHISDPPGGQLIEKHIDRGVGDWPVIMAQIPLNDARTIDAYELTLIWLYPALNERLYLCKTLGINADPHKDITFNRPIRREYGAFVDILARRRTVEEWGYGESPVVKTAKTKTARTKT